MRSRNTRTLPIAAMTAGLLVAGLGASTPDATEPSAHAATPATRETPAKLPLPEPPVPVPSTPPVPPTPTLPPAPDVPATPAAPAAPSVPALPALPALPAVPSAVPLPNAPDPGSEPSSEEPTDEPAQEPAEEPSEEPENGTGEPAELAPTSLPTDPGAATAARPGALTPAP
jgi:hypothetical protein